MSPQTLRAPILRMRDARFRLVSPLGVPLRSAIVVGCFGLIAVVLTLVLAKPTALGPGTVAIALVLIVVLLSGAVLVAPRPGRWLVVGWRATGTAATELLGEYAALARRRGHTALVATLERTRSIPGREILAYLASNGRYDLAGIRSSLETYRDPALRSKSAEVLASLEVGWSLQLVRIMVIQSETPQETLDAATLYESIVARTTLEKLPPGHQQLFVEALLDSGLISRAREVTATWTEPNEQRSRLIADSVSPFLGRATGGGEAEWLRWVNTGFESAGLEPVHLRAGDLPALDRVVCESTDVRDDSHRVTVVITSFRPDRSLVTAVASALASSWSNLEVLVVDDASGAEYARVYDEVRSLDARVRVESLRHNQGTYAGRNHALTLATGEFVTFHDSDDWMHPRRVELQARHLIDHPEEPANATKSIRVTRSLGFSNHRSLAAKVCEPSIMFRRELVVGKIGYFDRVRKNADTEYRRRLRAAFGTTVPVLGDVPLTWQRTVEGSLSFVDVGRSWISPARRAYMNCFSPWHARIADGSADPYLANSQQRTAPFYAPPEMIEASPEPRAFDVIFMSNWLVHGSHGGSQRSNEEEIRALTRAGMRVGIVNAEAFWFMHSLDSRLSDRVVAMLNSGEVELVQLDSLTTTDLLVIRYPPVLQFLPAVRSSIVAGRVVIVANQPPFDLDGSGRRYDIATCTQRVVDVFDRDPMWAPQGPLVRDVLARLVAGANLLPEDIPAIVDPPTWAVERRELVGRRPVVGRYSRDIATKWPESAKVLLAAYSSPDFDTRIMGGPEILSRVLGGPGRWPDSWKVLVAGEQDTRAFLAELDFFVYFHASYYREAFGRSIVEAMASGLVVILQKSFAEVFADAALYCEPAEVSSLVKRLVADPREYEAQVQRGMRFVEAHSSYSSYVALVRGLLPPSARSASLTRSRDSSERKGARA